MIIDMGTIVGQPLEKAQEALTSLGYTQRVTCYGGFFALPLKVYPNADLIVNEGKVVGVTLYTDTSTIRCGWV